jgi:Domain of unknown function (DUF4304)
MTDSKTIKEIIKKSLSKAGYSKKSDTWYFRNDEVVLLVNLQKSQYGNQYYLNCGVGLKSLGVVDFPKEYQCHIRFRIEGVMPEGSEKNIAALLNLEDMSISEIQRKDEISKLIAEYVLPTLTALSSINGISETIHSGVLKKAMIHKQVKDLVATR